MNGLFDDQLINLSQQIHQLETQTDLHDAERSLSKIHQQVQNLSQEKRHLLDTNRSRRRIKKKLFGKIVQLSQFNRFNIEK